MAYRQTDQTCNSMRVNGTVFIGRNPRTAVRLSCKESNNVSELCVYGKPLSEYLQDMNLSIDLKNVKDSSIKGPRGERGPRGQIGDRGPVGAGCIGGVAAVVVWGAVGQAAYVFIESRGSHSPQVLIMVPVTWGCWGCATIIITPVDMYGRVLAAGSENFSI